MTYECILIEHSQKTTTYDKQEIEQDIMCIHIHQEEMDLFITDPLQKYFYGSLVFHTIHYNNRTFICQLTHLGYLLIEHKRVTFLKWLIQHYNNEIERSSLFCYFAAKTQQLNLLKYFRTLTPPFPIGIDAFSAAIDNNNLHLLAWITKEYNNQMVTVGHDIFANTRNRRKISPDIILWCNKKQYKMSKRIQKQAKCYERRFHTLLYWLRCYFI